MPFEVVESSDKVEIKDANGTVVWTFYEDKVEFSPGGTTRFRISDTDIKALELLKANGGNLFAFHTDSSGRMEIATQYPMIRTLFATNPETMHLQAAAFVRGGRNSQATDSDKVWVPDAITMRNKTGEQLSVGDVVVSSGNREIKYASKDDDKLPMVVVDVLHNSGNDDTDVACMYGGRAQKVQVATAATVNAGDTLVTSSTNGEAKVNNSQTDPSRILGYADSSNVSGFVEMVKI